MKEIKKISTDQPDAATQPAASSRKDEKSPYLKSVLSGNIGRTGRVVRMAISDRLAAIRYIKESQWRSTFFRG
jgi:hypothetical protein